MPIAHAMRILNWEENLVGDEMPPPWMWPFTDELDEHFEWVKSEREAKSNPDKADDDRMDENALVSTRRSK